MNKKDQEFFEKLEQAMQSDEYFLMSYSKHTHQATILYNISSDELLIAMFTEMFKVEDLQPYLAMAMYKWFHSQAKDDLLTDITEN